MADTVAHKYPRDNLLVLSAALVEWGTIFAEWWQLGSISAEHRLGQDQNVYLDRIKDPSVP